MLQANGAEQPNLRHRAELARSRAKNCAPRNVKTRFVAVVMAATPAVSSSLVDVGHAMGFDVFQAAKGCDLKGLP